MDYTITVKNGACEVRQGKAKKARLIASCRHIQIFLIGGGARSERVGYHLAAIAHENGYRFSDVRYV